MRKKLIIILVGFLIGGGLVPVSGQLSYGGGLFWGNYLRNPGLDFRVEYPLTDALIIAPKLDISFPDLLFRAQFLSELCGHVHYYVINEEQMKLYPLAGLNIQSWLEVDLDPSPYVDINFGLGLCAGVGGRLALTDHMSFFGEARYAFGRYHQFVATAGVLFSPSQKGGETD